MNLFKHRHFEHEIIIWAVRGYCKYGISYRELEEMLGEKWYWRPRLGYRWRVDETYLKVKGNWAYLYRAIDKTGPHDRFLFIGNPTCHCRQAVSGQSHPGLEGLGKTLHDQHRSCRCLRHGDRGVNASRPVSRRPRSPASQVAEPPDRSRSWPDEATAQAHVPHIQRLLKTTIMEKFKESDRNGSLFEDNKMVIRENYAYGSLKA